jgi:subtilisin-like proprotein convertase family protein
MKYGYTLFLILFLAFNPLFGQETANFWRDFPREKIILPRNADVDIRTNEFRTLALDLPGMIATLQQAPQENTISKKKLFLSLPLPDGTMAKFSVEESSNMMPALQARYPQIRSFSAVGLDNKYLSARFDYSPKGFYAAIYTPQGQVYIDPYASINTSYYIAYYTKTVQLRAEDLPQLSCGVSETELQKEIIARERRPAQPSLRSAAMNVQTYRLALACTGEYAQRNGGTRPLVLSSMNTAMNRVNQIFGKEVAVKMQLISNNDSLIYLNPDTDPYPIANVGKSILEINTGVINQKIGATAYDIGHCFTLACTDVGGVAFGSSLCSVNKGAGVTCFYTNDINAIAVQVMAHEIGHQFSCGHSWNNCPSSSDQLSAANAFEPGSGSTIMSYAGSCGSLNNIQSSSDDYYNIGSLEDFIFYSRIGNGKNCATPVPSTNQAPSVIIARPTASLTLPISTPFQLNATGSDADNDALTYCWEEYDLGPSVNLGAPVDASPLFRSLPPSTAAFRVFPKITTIVRNTTDRTEVLPTYARDLTFRCTVRDNNPTAGGTAWEEIKFKVTDQAGPFVVLSPNTGNEVYKGGDDIEVRWDVAKTNLAPVNSKFVNIKMSLDGGFTYPYLLAQTALNDGSENVTLPNVTSASARIRVEAADHVFFDISNNDFKINSTNTQGFGITVSPYSIPLNCQPAALEYKITTNGLSGFNRNIKLELLGKLPQGVTYVFTSPNVKPGDSSFLRFDTKKILRDTAVLTLRASVEGVDTILRTIYFTSLNNDFSNLKLTTPLDGTSGIQLSTPFAWGAIPNAKTFDFELDTLPKFGSTAFATGTVTANGISINKLLPDNKLFFWRIRPTNECGTGPWTRPNTFQTASTTCKSSESVNVPVSIPSRNTPTIDSKIVITESGTINKVNVPIVQITYEYVRNLKIFLISPKGTQVQLYSEGCRGLTNRFIAGFDDNAPNSIEQFCPPDKGIVFKPNAPLSAFIGENQQGTWTLRVQVTKSESINAGTLEKWKLEFCSSLAVTNPIISANDTLRVPPGRSNVISKQLLFSQDPDATADQLKYVIVSLPLGGTLRAQARTLAIGDEFSQTDVNNGLISYLHNGGALRLDGFTFVVKDIKGGFVPVRQFNIKIDEKVTIGLRDPILQIAAKLYPNPTTNELNLVLGQTMAAEAQVLILNLQGQVVNQLRMAKGASGLQIDTHNLPSGTYFLQLRTAEGILSEKFIVQRD